MNLDHESWEGAAAYIPGEGPLERAEFAGDRSEVEITAAQREAVPRLRQNQVKPDKKNKRHDG